MNGHLSVIILATEDIAKTKHVGSGSFWTDILMDYVLFKNNKKHVASWLSFEELYIYFP